MIRHVVLFKFKPDVSDRQQEAWLQQVRNLPNEIDFIRGFSAGFDQMHLPRSYTAALVADFDSLDDVRTYATHPAHVPVSQLGVSLSESVASVDFEV